MNLFYKVRYKLSLVGRRITAHEIAQFQEEEKEDTKRAVEKNFIYSSLYRVFTEKRFVLLSHLQLVLQMLLFLPFFNYWTPAASFRPRVAAWIIYRDTVKCQHFISKETLQYVVFIRLLKWILNFCRLVPLLDGLCCTVFHLILQIIFSF